MDRSVLLVVRFMALSNLNGSEQNGEGTKKIFANKVNSHNSRLGTYGAAFPYKFASHREYSKLAFLPFRPARLTPILREREGQDKLGFTYSRDAGALFASAASPNIEKVSQLK